MGEVTIISGPPTAEVTLNRGDTKPTTIVNPPAVEVAITRHLGEGPFGPSTGNGSSFVWSQDTAATTWVIVHNLGRHPSVSVTDTTGEVILTTVKYLSENIVGVEFTYPSAGMAYLN